MSSYLAATFESLWATMRQALRKPSTVEYPDVKRPRAPRIRASFALLKDAEGDEACIGCKKCEKVCPSEVITIVGGKKNSPITGKPRGYATDFTLNLQACIICELCVQVCPTDAIVMVKEQESPGYAREDLTLTMDRLYRNGEKKERLAWSTASLLAEHQKSPEPPKPAAPVKAPAAAPAAPAPTAAAPAAPAPTAAAPAAPAPELPLLFRGEGRGEEKPLATASQTTAATATAPAAATSAAATPAAATTPSSPSDSAASASPSAPGTPLTPALSPLPQGEGGGRS